MVRERKKGFGRNCSLSVCLFCFVLFCIPVDFFCRNERLNETERKKSDENEKPLFSQSSGSKAATEGRDDGSPYMIEERHRKRGNMIKKRSEQPRRE